MFDKFQMKLQKLFNVLLHKDSLISNDTPSADVVTESALGYTKVNVIYYRTIDGYHVYRTIMLNEQDSVSICVLDKELYKNLDVLRRSYEERFEKTELFNLLSVDYIYLYKSGIFVDGVDLRNKDQILSDKVVHCLFVNGFLDEVLVHNRNINVKVYKPFDGDYSDVNDSNWSYELVDNYIRTERMKMFLSSDTLFSFNKISKSVIVNPIELLNELECTCVNCNYKLSHCGDLGMQIS